MGEWGHRRCKYLQVKDNSGLSARSAEIIISCVETASAIAAPWPSWMALLLQQNANPRASGAMNITWRKEANAPSKQYFEADLLQCACQKDEGDPFVQHCLQALNGAVLDKVWT